MKNNKTFIIDFDSTFIKGESLDLLFEISSAEDPDRASKLEQIQSITNQGMDGSISFRESLEKRLDILKATREDITRLVDVLKDQISTSIKRNRGFFKDNPESIYIISSGFKEFIVPVVSEFGIAEDHVFANNFEFDKEGNIVGFDKDNPLSGDGGKIEVMKKINLNGAEVIVVGDGFTDYQIYEAGLAQKFYAFTENVKRDKVLNKAKNVAPDFDEVLYDNDIEAAISYPKSRIKVLLLENVHAKAQKMFEEEGYQVEVYPAGLDEDELCEKIKDVSIIGIRSKTQITERVVKSAKRLISIGAFCIGTNQIDLEACTIHGVAVFNAPFSNTRSVVELAIGEIIMLMRNIPDTLIKMHNGQWNKSAKNSFEVRNKKLGIIGYGNIGTQLSVLAESIGMDVYYYDIVEKLPLGNVKKCDTLQELLSTVDVVTLHVDGRAANKNTFGDKEFSMMKEGSYFINLSRGYVVDLEALRKHVESGRIKGSAVDVYPEEPKSNDEPFDNVLRGLPNTILTSHIGGSTQEAQQNIADFVPSKIIDYVNTGSTFNSVNFPEIQLAKVENAHRLIHVHKNVPGILAKINNVLADHDSNVLGQYLKTNEQIGYLILAIDKEYNKALLDDLKKIENTIKLRVLY